jgi:glucosylceramidase
MTMPTLLNKTLLSTFLAVVFSQTSIAQTMSAAVFTTSKDSDRRISKTETLAFKSQAQPLETELFIYLDKNKKFQEMVGIGAAITDASAETFAKMSAEKQKEVAEAFFTLDKGIGYSLLRTTIHSSDFSSNSYTYVTEGDKELSTFSIAHDEQYRIPLIKKAFELSKNNMVLYASPWSPPAFMKTNNDMLRGGKLKPEYNQSWANYYVKFIAAYEKASIPVWGLSIQNEPMATQRWESCIYTAAEERDFLKNYLGPTLWKAGYADKKIIMWDHNRDLVFQRATELLSDPEAAKYVWGIGYHWYETWSGSEQMYDNIKLTQEAYPDKKIIFTEGCKESFKATKYKDWNIGEYYATSMIKDFNNGVVGWTDWNIFLDETGGPNHVQNFCFAPVHLDTKTDQVIYTNAFYYLGHFSKFIRPGAKRISCATSRSSVSATAFENTDKSIAVVVLNKSDNAYQYNLILNNQSVSIAIEPHAIQTVQVK